MRRNLARAVALALLAAAPLAPADVVLTGNQHVGDCDDAGGGCTGFTPLDPVSRNQMFNYPVNFSLTTTTSIDKVRLDGALDLDGRLQIYLETRGTSLGSSSSHFGTLSGSTFDLVPDLVLAPGEYVILPDGGCSESSGATFFYNCPGGKVNDFGFSSITLESTQSATSIMLNQRRHLGDNTDPSGDDDYDFTGTVSSSSNEFYPDAADGTDINLGFTLAANLRLTQIKFYRLRDINNESPTFATNPKLYVNGSLLGELTGEGDPFTFTLGNSLLLLAGTHTLRVESGSFSGQRDDFSWDDIVLVFASTTTSGTPGSFNAVDVGDAVLTGSITTRVAGGSSTLDLYALNGFGTGQDTTYNGGATVEVLDASNSSGTTDVYGCNSQWQFAQSLGSVTFVGGKATITGTFLDAGLKEARIQVTDSTTGAKGCSIDNFAIRPATLDVAPSHATETTAGLTTALTNAATGGLPRHKAGQPFTIVATGKAAGGATASNYDGSPTAATPVALAPATVAGTLILGNWDSAGGGARRTDTATYSEVGAVTLALEDASWASIDADDPTSTAAQRTITGSVNAGRFIPDHFNVGDGTLTTTCPVGGFSYIGGAGTLTWNTPAVTLTAVNASNGTTANYTGALETLPGTLAAPTYAVYDDPALAGTPALSTTGLSDATTISDATNGVATITREALAFERTLVAAFDAEIAITFPDIRDADDVVPNKLTIGSATAGGGLAFTGGKSQRFGRLYFEPRYGSENLPITVPLRAEYFDGVAFVPNAADSCTTLTDGQVALVPAAVGQTKALSPPTGAGPWIVTLSAPLAKGQATLSTASALYPLLMGDNDGDGYDDDPTGVATFGVYTSNDKRIYQREVVGN